MLTCRVQWLLMETEAALETEPAPAFFLALRHGDTVTVRKMLSTAGTDHEFLMMGVYANVMDA